MTREEREERLMQLIDAAEMHRQGYEIHEDLENKIRNIYTVGDPKAREAKEYLAEYVRGIALQSDKHMKEVVSLAAAEIEEEISDLEHNIRMTLHTEE